MNLNHIATTSSSKGSMETGRQRSTSRTRPVSRPTTPLRPSSRSSLRESARRSFGHAPGASGPNAYGNTGGGTGSLPGSSGAGGSGLTGGGPLDALESGFAELSDSMADLEANLMHLQLMHESLARFSESFAAFLYGLNMNAFCVDFSEVCTVLNQSHQRERVRHALRQGCQTRAWCDG